MASTERRRPAGTRRGVARSRRSALALGVTVTLAGGLTLAGASAAQAQAAPCQEYVGVWQTTSDGKATGPGTTTLSPTTISISNTADSNRYIFTAGVTRPRRSADFRFIDQSNASVAHWTTTASGDNGVIKQESNVHEYSFTHPGDRIDVYADFHTRCGGDDVLKTNVYVGSIVTLP